MSHAQYFLEATYLIASCLFVLGLKGLSHPDTARRGMIMAAAGMAAAVIGTLFHPDIHNYIY
ncbi:MAG TPA: NAD(P)(+) transhydrogenase (Re/Si-specific) subunit beta, partial [Candidatus Angelobacter sp.]|nr:NAD(P)(+) transhydrogenase (Re/Si-specific) subunit beta [Candidatus Angelobacter sp.]